MSDDVSIKNLLAEFEEDSQNLGAITEEAAAYQVEAQTFSIPEGATLIELGQPITPDEANVDPTMIDQETPEWVLMGTAGAENGNRFPVKDTITMGRSSKADHSIDDTLISRQHVRITPKADGLLVEDLDSSNGTFVNDQPISSATLQPGDTLSFGDISFTVQGPQQEAKTEVRSEPIQPEPGQAQRFCTDCGNHLNSESRFCIQCGKEY